MHQRLLEPARQGIAAIEDGDLVPGQAIGVAALDFGDDRRGFGVGVSEGQDFDRIAGGLASEQRLAEPSLILRDDGVGRGENMRGRAKVLLQPEQRRAGKFMREAADEADIRASEAVHALVIVADHEDLVMLCGEQSQPVELRMVDVLELVREQAIEPPGPASIIVPALQHGARGSE